MTVEPPKTGIAQSGMEVYIDRDELVRALQRASTAVERNGAIPGASDVLLCAADAGLEVTATDTQVAYVGTMGALSPCVLRDPDRDDALHVVMPQREE